MVTINGKQLTIDQVVHTARSQELVSLADESRLQIEQASQWIQSIISQDKPVYGINTGFGIFADRPISNSDAARLSRNLILSHAVGTGDPLPTEVVRAAMLIRANTLAKGHSGVRPVVIDTLLAMLNSGLTPEIPSQGSLGSSGDLAPLSHMALVFTTDQEMDEADTGFAYYQGRRMTGQAAMQAAGLQPIVLGPKEGLAVSNGATFSAALGALAVADARNLLSTASITIAMSLEALKGVSTAFDPRLHTVRPHPGQMAVASEILDLIQGSSLVNSDGRVQDAYSLRCAPQVQGAVADALDFIQALIAREINSATDNPLLFSEGDALSGGNFHGEPVGMAMDFLGIAVAEVAGISERRIFRLTDGKLNADLPPMLVDHPQAAGLNSGMMMPQYTAASLVLENQTLASPDSVYSLPTSAEQEDHNANSMTAARHARQIVENTAHVLAIEAYTAARALDIRLRERPATVLGAGTSAAHQLIRDHVPYQPGDAWWGPEIEQVKQLIISGQFVQAVQHAIDGSPYS